MSNHASTDMSARATISTVHAGTLIEKKSCSVVWAKYPQTPSTDAAKAM
jgi:hypothetical protein